jgi:predicted enzyme related to lactoylglutathione lyase
MPVSPSRPISAKECLMPSAINWFQIPASDAARAKTFSETICGV